MPETLNVIALISGGKDSIYSILHCLQNGHHVVALGNLYPPPWHYGKSQESYVATDSVADEHDLNSFMYQTVGHTVVPLYEEALGIPLYRQPILGIAVQTGSSYQPNAADSDETESLVPLLKTIMAAHPETNAVSTGAILSTYQRTRIESVALRLGLVPLSFLWQYPTLPPGTQVSLLQDMASAGLDARIIKVASGGLDESFLWENVASTKGVSRVEKAMARFGMDGDGAVLGEGGEFETLVLDGPDQLFKGRIVVDEEDRKVVRDGGGAAWLSIRKARVEMKEGRRKENRVFVRVPDILESRFLGTVTSWALQVEAGLHDSSRVADDKIQNIDKMWDPCSAKVLLKSSPDGKFGNKWMVVARIQPGGTIEQEMEDITEQMRSSFKGQDIELSEVSTAVILLRTMKHFSIVNKVYGALFNELNPPARVTIACGDVFPRGYNVIIQLSFFREPGVTCLRKSLHVQSRSYWTPANIGPYSQARSVPLLSILEPDRKSSLVHVAGQIPLIPSTMALARLIDRPPEYDPVMDGDLEDDIPNYKTQTVLSLQHLWRVGMVMDVLFWTGAVAYLARDTSPRIAVKAKLAGAAWEHQHHTGRTKSESDGEESSERNERDLWEERYHGGFQSSGHSKAVKALPDWSVVSTEGSSTVYTPPFFAAEVEELPRESDIEWHAFPGLTSGPIKVSSHAESSIGIIYTCSIRHQVSYTTLFLPYKTEIHHLAETLDTLMSTIETTEESTRRRSSTGYYNSDAAYLDVCVNGLWDTSDYSGMIPCRSLWDKDGNRLAAVLLFHTRLNQPIG